MYEGMRWQSLSHKEKEELLEKAVAIDATTCSTPNSSMECIVDFQNGLSCSGYYDVESGEISVNDDAVIYNPEEGIKLSFSDKIKSIYKTGVTKKRVLDIFGIPRNTQLQWEKGERIPPEWQQALILYSLKNIENEQFLKELKKYKPAE